MIAKLLAAAGLISCALVAHAADPWSETQQASGIALGTLLVVDYLQTRQIAKQPEIYHETNPVLGKHPSISTVNTYFAGVAILGYLALDALPSDMRSWALGAGIVLELAVTAHNNTIGLKARW